MIFTFGETVLDILFKQMQPVALKAGGSALNTSISLALLGNQVSFVSEIGNDQPGKFCVDFLKNNNVNVSHIQTYDGNTSLALAFLNDKNDATYQFYKNLPNATEINNIEFSNNDLLLFSSSFALSQRVRNSLVGILENAKKNNTLVMYDPNMRKQIFAQSIENNYIIENFRYANVVRASDEDCQNIFGLSQPDQIFKKLQVYGVQVFIYTQSSNVVEVFTPFSQYKYSVLPLIPISTIGAGDTFNAGILHFLQQSLQTGVSLENLPSTFWDKAIPFAIQCASLVCMSLENYITPSQAERLLSIEK